MTFGNLTKKPFVRRKPFVRKHTVAVVEKEVKKMKKKMKVETKYLTTSLVGTFPIASSATAISNPSQGAALDERVGAQCRVTGVDLKFYLFNSTPGVGSFLTSPYVVRIILFCNKQNNSLTQAGQNLVLDQLFDDDPNLPGIPFYFTTLRNREFLKRYHVLFDKIYVIGPSLLASANANTGDQNKNFITFHKSYKQNQILKFTEADVNGTPGGTIQGQYYIGLYSTLGPPLIPTSDYSIQVRLKFEDV